MVFASDRHIIPIVQENVRYEGVIEVKGIEYIPYSPSCCDDCIFEIIRTFRQLHNINEIKVRCWNCGKTYSYSLSPLQEHETIAKLNCLIRYRCRCGELVCLESKTLEERERYTGLEPEENLRL